MSPWFGFVIMLGFGYFFYRAADFEKLERPLLWGGASALLYLGTTAYLRYGLLAAFAVQFGLYVWLGVWLAIHGRGPRLWPAKHGHRQHHTSRGGTGTLPEKKRPPPDP